MKWYLKIFSYIESKTLFDILRNDLEFFKEVSKKILIDSYNIDLKKYKNFELRDNTITHLLNLYPRITHFNIDDCSIENEIIFKQNSTNYDGKYLLLGEHINEFIFSDKLLPNKTNSNIPFTFQIVNNNNEIEFLNSNIYYFEIKLDFLNFRQEFDDENLQIGFISSIFEKNEIIFGDDFSYGLDLKENSLKLNNIIFQIPEEIVKGDVIGLGLEYLKNNYYQIILTVNGKRILFEQNQGFVKNSYPLKIGMNLGLSYGVNINFGENPFYFDIKSIINCPEVLNICSSNYVNIGFNDIFINTLKTNDRLEKWRHKNLLFKNINIKKNLLEKSFSKLKLSPINIDYNDESIYKLA